MSDQLFGQVLAHICSLGYLLDRSKIRKTLQSIMKFNYREDFYSHFNHLRSYALNDDRGLVIATYPHGGALERPFPYAYEVWSGIEWTAAAGMIYEGQLEDALKVAEAIRARHDGERRNPFSEEECGRHYARAMACWGCLLAYTGFSYDGITRTLSFKASSQPVKWFFSTGYGWGTIQLDDQTATIEVLHGEVPVRMLQIGGKSIAIADGKVLSPGLGLSVRLN